MATAPQESMRRTLSVWACSLWRHPVQRFCWLLRPYFGETLRPLLAAHFLVMEFLKWT